jgi:tetratricopeptide (TPR) repeat protein
MSDNGYYAAVRRILAAIKPEALKQFQQLKTDESRVEFVRSLGVDTSGGRGLVESALRVEPVERRRRSSSSTKTTSNNSDAKSSGKSSDEAKKYRQRGNELYEKGRLAEALDCYTKSVLVAPVEDADRSGGSGSGAGDEAPDGGGAPAAADGSEPGGRPQTRRQQQQQLKRCESDAATVNAEYVLALGNRSACLLQMKRYDECLRDIDQALGHGYPPALRYKLLDRRARALIETNRFAEAAVTLQSLLDGALTESRLDNDRRSTMARGTEKKLNYCTSVMVSSTNANAPNATTSASPTAASAETAASTPSGPISSSDPLPPVSGSKSERFPGAADAFDVRYQADRGRYGVVTRDVAVGDVLLVESPYVSVLSPDQYHVRCYGCFQANVQVPLGCYCCSTVRSVSYDCMPHQSINAGP